VEEEVEEVVVVVVVVVMGKVRLLFWCSVEGWKLDGSGDVVVVVGESLGAVMRADVTTRQYCTE
jgi:hypothetical protein